MSKAKRAMAGDRIRAMSRLGLALLLSVGLWSGLAARAVSDTVPEDPAFVAFYHGMVDALVGDGHASTAFPPDAPQGLPDAAHTLFDELHAAVSARNAERVNVDFPAFLAPAGLANAHDLPLAQARLERVRAADRALGVRLDAAFGVYRQWLAGASFDGAVKTRELANFDTFVRAFDARRDLRQKYDNAFEDECEAMIRDLQHASHFEVGEGGLVFAVPADAATYNAHRAALDRISAAERAVASGHH